MSMWLIMHGIWCEYIGHPLKSIINPKILFYLYPENCKNTSSILNIWAIWKDLEERLNVTLQSNSLCVTLIAIVNCFHHFHAWELLHSMPSQFVICAMLVVSQSSWMKTYSWSLIYGRFIQYVMIMEENLLSYVVFRAI